MRESQEEVPRLYARALLQSMQQTLEPVNVMVEHLRPVKYYKHLLGLEKEAARAAPLKDAGTTGFQD